MDIDRYLRNNLDDADYAEAAAELNVSYKRIAKLQGLLVEAILHFERGAKLSARIEAALKEG